MSKMWTRLELKQWMEQMIESVIKQAGAVHSQIHLGDTGSKYSSQIRDFESFSRPLWGVFSLLRNNEKHNTYLDFYIKGIKEGIEPTSAGYWGEPGNRSQMLVEMAVFGFGMAFCQDKLMKYFTKKEKNNLENWMNKAIICEFPENNWQFFCVLMNMGLKLNHMAYNPEKLAECLLKIDSYYLGEGWYQDGSTKQRDYYIAFAFHFYGILYSTLVSEDEGEKYRDRAELFALDFVSWFDKYGRCIPFGRSLTYRFAQVAFWSVIVFAGIKPFPLGVMKGLIFRNLRWWKAQNIYSSDGILSIGYAYPNLIISEDYNSPGSPLWSFKSFVLFMIPQDDLFWQIPEIDLPELPVKRVQLHAGFIIVGNKESNHHYVLSSGQYPNFPILHSNEKYAKFCYSTHFGFNISRDQSGLLNIAVDSMLVLGIPGTNQYYSRGDSIVSEVHENYLFSQWQYGRLAEIKTWLIPIDDIFHLRFHKIKANCNLETCEGAFPIEDQKELNEIIDDATKLLVMNKQGTSGIVDLNQSRKLELIKQNPNSNIYTPEKTIIPTLKNNIEPGDVVLGCAIIGANYKLNRKTIQDSIPLVEISEHVIHIQHSRQKIKLLINLD